MTSKRLSALDELIAAADGALRTVFGRPPVQRPSPAVPIGEHADASPAERRLSGQLMRVNHAGEVCAQALYQGQALTARNGRVRDAMEHAANEENDHLAWCQQRLDELGTHTSLLNPLWYTGSFAIGVSFGLLGDKWSLGFLAETERQVVRHLERHLETLPDGDGKSRAILEQMRNDEAKHATGAVAAGGADLPMPIRRLMATTSKIMTSTARFV